jgi:hypothetical protein
MNDECVYVCGPLEDSELIAICLTLLSSETEVIAIYVHTTIGDALGVAVPQYRVILCVFVHLAF